MSSSKILNCINPLWIREKWPQLQRNQFKDTALVSIPYESGKSGHLQQRQLPQPLNKVSIPYESGKSGHVCRYMPAKGGFKVSIPYESGKSGHEVPLSLEVTMIFVSIPYESGKSGHHNDNDNGNNKQMAYQSLMNQGKVATWYPEKLYGFGA